MSGLAACAAVLAAALPAAAGTLPGRPEPEMTSGAWIFLFAGWAFVIGLALWCFKRVLGGRSSG